MNTKSSLRLLHEALFTHTLGPELQSVVSKHLPARENRPTEEARPSKTRPAQTARAVGWTAPLILLVAPLHAREGIKKEALGESELVALADGFEDRRDALLRQQIQRPFPPGDAGDLGAALSALFLQTDNTKANETLLHFTKKGFRQIRPPRNADSMGEILWLTGGSRHDPKGSALADSGSASLRLRLPNASPRGPLSPPSRR